MIDLLAPRYGYDPKEIMIQYIGAKAGEKLYEELMTEEETQRSYELEDMFAILPAHRFMYKHVEHVYTNMVKTSVGKAYISATEKAMTVEEIKTFLTDSGVLESCSVM